MKETLNVEMSEKRDRGEGNKERQGGMRCPVPAISLWVPICYYRNINQTVSEFRNYHNDYGMYVSKIDRSFFMMIVFI